MHVQKIGIYRNISVPNSLYIYIIYLPAYLFIQLANYPYIHLHIYLCICAEISSLLDSPHLPESNKRSLKGAPTKLKTVVIEHSN